MIIVAGSLQVEPASRETFLEQRRATMRRSRREPGCLEYVFGADPLDPGRVVLFERWASREALDAHVATLRSSPPIEGEIAPRSSSVAVYDVVGERRLGG